MTDYVSFEGIVEPMEWGKATYTVLPIPQHVLDALGPTKRVEGEMNDHPVNLALTTAPVIDGVFVWAGKTLLREIGIEPSDPFEVRLRAAPSDVVDVPPDVITALRSAGVLDEWNALTAGKKRGMLHHVTSAKREDTRIKRLAKLIAEVSA